MFRRKFNRKLFNGHLSKVQSAFPLIRSHSPWKLDEKKVSRIRAELAPSIESNRGAIESIENTNNSDRKQLDIAI